MNIFNDFSNIFINKANLTIGYRNAKNAFCPGRGPGGSGGAEPPWESAKSFIVTGSILIVKRAGVRYQGRQKRQVLGRHSQRGGVWACGGGGVGVKRFIMEGQSCLIDCFLILLA